MPSPFRSSPAHRPGRRRGPSLWAQGTSTIRKIIEFVVWVAIFALLAWAFIPGLGPDLASLEKRGWPSVSPGPDSLSDLPATPVVEALKSLPIRPPHQDIPHYNRHLFGEAWADVDGNGCSTREDVLRRDLDTNAPRPAVIDKNGTVETNRSQPASPGFPDARGNLPGVRPDGCKVNHGLLKDPYTGKEIWFQRGQDTSPLVQIDHIVALADAWDSGAWAWDNSRRTALANDPLELVAVAGWANQDKGRSDASQWLPPNAAYHCEYAARQIAVKQKYGLSVTAAEHDALARIIRSCPDQTLPTEAETATNR